MDTVEVEKFNELEQKVKGIIEEHALIKKRNRELESMLEGANAELAEAKNRIRALNDEQGTVRGRIDALLGMLRNIDVPE
ncbi:MAG: cell division protein ZapB [Deltaproteobacteria bacterium]|nr:cell division protein ZapB [Deltaproteobacteria bacterium]